MPVRIAIDTREPVLKSLLTSYFDNYLQNSGAGEIDVQTEQLDIGDVVIRLGNKTNGIVETYGTTDGVDNADKETDDDVKIIFERKSCSDLAASVKDGRYKEQKARLLSNGTLARRVFYILEDVPNMKELITKQAPIYGMKPSVLSGMMVYSMLRDGVHVICVKNTNETAAWIWSIALKCLTNPDKIIGGGDLNTTDGRVNDTTGVGNYLQNLQNVKVKKIDNITPTSCYVMQLCQIPNISITTANGIVAKYPTMLVLLNVLAELPDNEHRIKCLCELPMIGKKKAQTILMYLLPGY